MLLLIDNYDSFVHNLARYIRRLGVATRVVRNDELSIDHIEAIHPQAIVISPGPCAPSEAGNSIEVVQRFAGRIPILGVCLGHQAIAQALGGRVVRAADPMHGQSSLIEHDATGLFAGLPSPLEVGRYHSLVVERQSLPGRFRVTAATADGVIMAIEDESASLFGVQFHPESILTTGGYELLANFLRMAHFDDVAANSAELFAGELVEPRQAIRSLPSRPVTF